MVHFIQRVAGLAVLAAVFLPEASMAGDPEAGEREWGQCLACHRIVTPSGETIQRGGTLGPNLYGIVGRQAGTIEGAQYSPGLVAAGQAGMMWNEENFVAFLSDPSTALNDFLRAAGQTPNARSTMAFRMRNGATDMFAYLQSLSPGFSGGGAIFGQTAACTAGFGVRPQAVAVSYTPSELSGPPSQVSIVWPEGSEHVSLWGEMSASNDFLGGAGRQSWTRFVFYPTRPLIRVIYRQVTAPAGRAIDQADEVVLRLRLQNFAAIEGCSVTLVATLRRI